MLSAPNGPLFASVSGLRKWLPWIIFMAFGIVAVATLVLSRRALRDGERVRETNAQLAEANSKLGSVNGQLAEANSTLQRRARELARSNAELEQFASIASHDLQEPLRKVRTFTERITETEQDRLSERGLDYLRRANASAERMQRLIEDLLKFSRVATQGRPFEPSICARPPTRCWRISKSRSSAPVPRSTLASCRRSTPMPIRCASCSRT